MKKIGHGHIALRGLCSEPAFLTISHLTSAPRVDRFLVSVLTWQACGGIL